MKRGWTMLAAALAATGILLGTGAADALTGRLRDAVYSGELAAAALELEWGVSLPPAEEAPAEEPEDKPPADPAPERESGEEAPAAAPESAPPAPEGPDAAAPEDAGPPEAVPEPTPEPAPEPQAEPVPEAAPEGAAEVQTLPAREEGWPVPEPLTAVFSAQRVINRTSLDVDTDALLAEELDIHLSAQGPQILILHTHGTEAFTQDPEHRYVSSDEYRTTDTGYNVVLLGDLLCDALSAQGLRVIHDRTLYDYPSYTGSYARSGAAVERALESYPELAVIIDLHRDALGSGDVIYKTRAEVSDATSAQVMLLVGTGENGLEHPDWRENFKLALRMKAAMDEMYPTLARPIELVKERYNQHYTHGSLLLEVGSSGNTLPEAVCAVGLFARAVGPVLLELAEE